MADRGSQYVGAVKRANAVAESLEGGHSDRSMQGCLAECAVDVNGGGTLRIDFLKRGQDQLNGSSTD